MDVASVGTDPKPLFKRDQNHAERFIVELYVERTPRNWWDDMVVIELKSLFC